MPARTKDIGAASFRARLVDGVLAATGGACHLAGVRWAPGRPRCSPGSAAQHHCAPAASGPGASCSSRGATNTGGAGAAPGSIPVPRPSVHIARATGRAPNRHNAIPAVTPTATTSAARSRVRSAARRRQPLPGRRRQLQVEGASVEHRERVPCVSRGHAGGAHACRRGVRLAGAGQVSSWNTVSRNPSRLAGRRRRSSRAPSAPGSLNNTTNGKLRRLNLRKPPFAPRTSDSLTPTVFGVRLHE